MASLTGFRQMIADRAEADKGLPQVNLRGCCDLDMALNRLVTVDNRGDDESDAQVASRYTDEIVETLNREENKEVAEKLNATIECFRDKITEATKSLGEIRASARTLAEEMETFKTDALARDPFVSTHLNLTTLSVDYPTWEWNGPKTIGSSTYIKERVGSQLVAKDAAIPEEWNYRLFLFGCSTMTNRVKLADATGVTPDEVTTLIDQLTEAMGDAVSKENITKVVTALTVAATLRGTILDLQRIVSMSPSDMFSRIKDYDAFIQTYYPVADAITAGTVTLPDSDWSAVVKQNADAVKTLCEFMAYYELMERETLFAHSILLQGGVLNADEKANYEHEGGTPIMIAHYIRFMYKDDVTKIPARGISSKVIIESAAHNEKVVKADISNITNRIAVATTSARVAAFNTVARRYITSKVDRELPNETDGTKVTKVAKLADTVGKKIANRILHHDICFVDACLMLIVELDYAGTFVEQMYNELGAAYLAKASETGTENVTDEELKVAEMSVIAKMVANFVVGYLIEVCPCKDKTPKSPIVPAQEG